MHRSTPWRREIMDVVFPAHVREQVLVSVAGGISLETALAEYDLSPAAAYGRARRDEGFRNRLYAALMAGRDPSLKHGSAWTYQHYKCRCPECLATQPACTAARRWLQERVPS